MNLIALTNAPAAVKISILPNVALKGPGAMPHPVKGKVLLWAFRHEGLGERPMEIEESGRSSYINLLK